MINIPVPSEYQKTESILTDNELTGYVRIKVGDKLYDYVVKPKVGNIGEVKKISNFDPTVDKITVVSVMVKQYWRVLRNNSTSPNNSINYINIIRI